VTGPAEAAAATSRTPQGNLNLRARNVVNSISSIASTINAHIFSGNGAASPKQITGFDSAIGDTTNSYAGLARGSYSWWEPYVVSPGSATDISFAQIREDLKSIFVRSGETPGVAFCHPGVFNAIGALYDSNRSYTIDVMENNRGKINLSGGFAGIEIDGCVFVKDKDATLESGNASGRVYYCNTNYVELQVQVQAGLRELLPGLPTDDGTMLTANDGFGELPLLAVVEKLAKTGDATKYQTKVYCELKVSRPNACGVRRYVNVATS
jgi:hypothetical protein